ncbi:SDR family NAD(P)-dependent oxidoreductase [Pseudonocardia lacus]|uniref:SDR family NAD(P)-dependent oxidoreductase n=1 Tax=Pseudonocardia lacus TaxID=2835865 RepID=UPI001BDC73BB|nr:SDR family NAD(P)-dependent oxidoreductase [Pseudonocardia lacus]
MTGPREQDQQTHAVVTGAAQGIGAAIAVGLADAGHAVTVLDVKDTAETVRSIKAAGHSAAGAQADVRDRDAVRAAIDAASERGGGLDVLVTCAGIYGAVTTIDELTQADLDSVLGVNLAGTIWTVQAALPHLRRRGGRVVCVGSVAGRNGGLLSGPHYGASKGGVHAFVRWLAKTEAGNGILANAIAPGPIDTPMLQGRGYTADAVPLRRFGRAEEIAAVAVFLASPGASYITGTVVDANGGSFIG